MRTLLATVLLCGSAYAADIGTPQTTQTASIPLAQKCAMASVLLRDNRCAPYTCDEALGRAIQAGCRINYWGHTPLLPPNKR